MNISLIIPVYNEEESICKVLEEATFFVNEVIVVDDGSRDRTSEMVSKYNVMLVKHEKNLGKGQALKSGARHASGQALVFMDGDGQHNPLEIESLAEPILRGEADVVLGYRNLEGAPLIRKFSNFLAKSAIKLFAKQTVNDPLCGFRAVNKDAFNKFNLTKKGYEFEFDMIFEALKNDLRISNVPVSVDYKVGRSSITLWDNVKIIFFVLKKLITDKKNSCRCKFL